MIARDEGNFCYMESQIQDNLKTLTEATNHLAYLESVIASSKLSKHIRQNLEERIQEIRTRYTESTLKVAIIGGTSTGKSTFINALLQDRLLSTQALSTNTAVHTVIKHGTELAVEVCFRLPTDETTTKVLRLTKLDEPITILEFPELKEVFLPELITVLTTSNQIAQQIIGLTISHPAEVLKHGICLVDTPGVDAVNMRHTQIIRKVISQVDATIITTSAKQIIPSSLIQIINRDLHLRPFLHRCLILITGMDMIDQRERKHLVQTAQQRLDRGLMLSKNQALPPVFYASPQAEIDELEEEHIIADEQSRYKWKKHFKQLKSELLTYLNRQQLFIISENLLELLNHLFIALEIALNDNQVKFRKKRLALEKSDVLDIHFFQQQNQECTRRIRELFEKTRMRMDSKVTLAREAANIKMTRTIHNARSIKALDLYVEEGLPRLIAKQNEDLQKEFSYSLLEINQAAQSASDLFDKRFSEACHHSLVLQKLSKLEFSDVIGFPDGHNLAIITSQIEESTRKIALKTADFNVFRSSSMDEYKKELIHVAQLNLIEQFLATKTSITQAIYDYYQALKAAIAERIDICEKLCAESIGGVQRQRKYQSIQIARDQACIRQTLDEITFRHRQVQLKMEAIRSRSI